MYCIYNTTTGALVSSTDNAALIANPLPAGLASKLVADPPSGYLWNPTTLDFVAPPNPSVLDKIVFIKRFALAEGAAMTASTDTTVRYYMDHVLANATSVDLNDTLTQAAVQYMVTIGLLTAARATAVLTP